VSLALPPAHRASLIRNGLLIGGVAAFFLWHFFLRWFGVLEVASGLLGILFLAGFLLRLTGKPLTPETEQSLQRELWENWLLQKQAFKEFLQAQEETDKIELRRISGVDSDEALVANKFSPEIFAAEWKKIAAASRPISWFSFLANAIFSLACVFALTLGPALLTRSVITSPMVVNGFSFLGLLLGLAITIWLVFFPPEKTKSTAVSLAFVGSAGIFFTLLVAVVAANHSYLLPWTKDRHQLAADRVLELHDSVKMEHASIYLRLHAEELLASGQTETARSYLEELVKIAPWDMEGKLLLAQCLLDQGQVEKARTILSQVFRFSSDPDILAAARAMNQEMPVLRSSLPRFLPGLIGYASIVLVPTDDADPFLVEVAGLHLSAQLGVDVFLWDKRFFTNPPRSGLQSTAALQVRLDQLPPRLIDHLQPWSEDSWMVYIFVTNRDITYGTSNYVFGVSWENFGVVSYHRMGDGLAASQDLLLPRLLKQLVSTAYQCLGLPRSSNPADVTSYVRSLAELDRKQIDFDPETGNRFNTHWQQRRIAAAQARKWGSGCKMSID
jgi:predicted Zn-dependent protease/tetratricopeptide (TPR) repeat protein